MSLAIDVDRVRRVLLHDGWHEVLNHSFELDSYEFLWSGRSNTFVSQLRDDQSPHVLLSGGQPLVPSLGFGFRTQVGSGTDISYETVIYGPLTSILAVEYED